MATNQKVGKFFRKSVPPVVLVLFSLPFLLISTNALPGESYWEYTGETYNDRPLNCDVNNGFLLDWAKKVADLDGPKDVGGIAVPDGEVQYVVEEQDVFSVINWSRPYYDQSTKTIRMHLSAQDLKNPSTIRVGAGGSVGGPVEALSWDSCCQVVTYAIPTAHIEPFGDSFNITVYANNGGTCAEGYLAKYYFSKW